MNRAAIFIWNVSLIGPVVSEKNMCENVNVDGRKGGRRRSHLKTISSPMNLHAINVKQPS